MIFSPSASSALKGNSFSSKAISASEIVKLAGSIGSASGGYWSRLRSQARSSSLSSRSAAFRNASKNRWRGVQTVDHAYHGRCR
jgi:hypothetical protein